MKLVKHISTPLLGVVVYTLTPYFISILGLPSNYNMVIQLPMLFLVFWGLWQMPNYHHRMCDKNGFSNLLYYFYVVLLIVMFLRGPLLSERIPGASIWGLLSFYVSDPYYLLWTLMPYVVLRMFPDYNLRGLIKIVYWACIICGIVALLRLPQMIAFSFAAANESLMDASMSAFLPARLGLAIGAVFLCMNYLTKRQRLVITISFIINILTVVLLARRGAIMMSVLLLIFYFMLQYKEGSTSRKFGIVFMIALLIGFYFFTSSSSLFNYVSTRGFEDSRSGVDEALLSSMNDFELWFGKGLNGKYYYLISSGIEADIYNGWRYSSETGFYNIVLKGGYVMAITYIALLLFSAIKGIFRSNNIFCKAGGLYILWSVIYLYPFGVLSFDVSFFFIWMWVILCSISKVRKMSNEEIQRVYF